MSIWKEDPTNTTTIMMTVSFLVCPSEVNPSVSSHDYGLAGVTNYGVSQGDWFVFGGFSGPLNRNAFGMNRRRRIAEFTDGTSSTLLLSEVKARQPGSNCRTVLLSKINDPNNVPPPQPTPTPWPPTTPSARST